MEGRFAGACTCTFSLSTGWSAPSTSTTTDHLWSVSMQWMWLCFVCLLWFFVCFLFFFRHRDDPIGPCKGPPTVRPLLVHLFTKMAEFTAALINGQHAACNSVLIDLAKAKRRWTEKNTEQYVFVEIALSYRSTLPSFATYLSASEGFWAGKWRQSALGNAASRCTYHRQRFSELDEFVWNRLETLEIVSKGFELWFLHVTVWTCAVVRR